MKADERAKFDEKMIGKVNELVDYTKSLENKIIEIEGRLPIIEPTPTTPPATPAPAVPVAPVTPPTATPEPAVPAPTPAPAEPAPVEPAKPVQEPAK